MFQWNANSPRNMRSPVGDIFLLICFALSVMKASCCKDGVTGLLLSIVDVVDPIERDLPGCVVVG